MDLPGQSFDTFRFNEPAYLWLLLVPLVLSIGWLLRAVRWRRDARRLRERRVLPVPERYTWLGAWPFWGCLIGALLLTVLAVARPQGAIIRSKAAGVDLIVLQDGSASMHVRDVAPDRWRRSMRFLRVLAESLQWEEDRLALALFARIAAPQVRLTRDPNTFFFFLDHLADASPFPLRDDTTWDTNIEEGIYWGTRLVDKDAELNGPSRNGQAFLLLSDGQAWSGEIERALQRARARQIPVFVIGVGTAAGGLIPEPAREPGDPRPPAPSVPLHASLDRNSLISIAGAGGGSYFDLGVDTDRKIANSVIDAVRRRAGPRSLDEDAAELYWYCLAAAAALLGLSTCFLRDSSELWLQTLGAASVVLLVWKAIV